MSTTPPITGWRWLQQGFALFRKQPMEISTLFLTYMFGMFAMAIIPVLGQILPLVLVPTFSMAFLQACVKIERGERIYPSTLLYGFRSPRFRTLLLLGVLYLVAVMAALGASILVDDGSFWRFMSGQETITPENVRDTDLTLGMLFSLLVYLPALMAFWFAAPLIVWQDMGAFKAMFYSFFAVWRAARAFLVYGLAWLLIGVILPLVLTSLVVVLVGGVTVAKMILLPLSLIMTVVMYCSFYPMYAAFFAKPELPPPPPASTTTEN
jgi:uncharacterized membrane protein